MIPTSIRIGVTTTERSKFRVNSRYGSPLIHFHCLFHATQSVGRLSVNFGNLRAYRNPLGECGVRNLLLDCHHLGLPSISNRPLRRQNLGLL